MYAAPLKMLRKKVAIIVDNPKRDLPSCVLVACSLATKGIDAYLLPINQMAQSLFTLRPDYVLLNYIRINNEKIATQLSRAGIPFGVLDTEGGVFTRLPDTKKLNFFNVLSSNKKILSVIQDYFCWGTDILSEIKLEGCFRDDQLSLTGTPRTDFYHRSFLPYHQSSIQNQKCILINSSFPIIGPKFSTKQKELSELHKKFNYTQSFLDQLVVDLETARNKLIAVAESLANKFPDQGFVFRAHPFEDDTIYKNAFVNLPNMTVTNERTVDEWLMNSLALVHYECSTAIEASLIGVPALSFSGHQSIKPIIHADKVTHFLNNADEFVQVLQQIIEKKYVIPTEVEKNKSEVHSQLYAYNDGRAYLRITENLFKRVESQKEKPSKFLSTYYVIYYRLLRCLKIILKRHHLPKEKSYSKNDVEKLVQKINPCLPTPVKGEVVDLGYGCIGIKSHGS